MSGSICVFWPSLPGPGCQPNEQLFGSSFFLEYRLSPESLEPLIGFRAHLKPKLWLKKKLVIILLPQTLTWIYYTRGQHLP